MKKKSLFLLILFLAVFFIFGFKNQSIKAEEQDSVDLVKNAESAILIELNTGQVLYNKNTEEKRSPASMTKIMSMYLIMDALDKGSIKWTDVVTVSEHAASYGGSQVYLEAGEKMTVEDLFKCMVIASANDATVALAEQAAGSEEMFVKQMNDKAKFFGLKNTVFKDPTGLTDFEEGHYTTASDMAMMARALIRDYGDVVLKYTSIYEDYIRENTDKKFWLVNTNKLVKHYPGIDGLKTGWTSGAGYNLTATMKKDGMRLISVVMGESTPSQRNYDTIKLLNYGFSQFQVVEYKSKNVQVGEVSNMLLTPTKIKIVTDEPIYFVIPKGKTVEGIQEKVNFTIKEGKTLAGEKIGDLTLIKDGKVVYTVPLTVAQDVEKASFFEVLGRMIKSMFLK